MRIWLVKTGEQLPIDGDNIRLLRIGMLADILSQAGHEVTWWASTFSHVQKSFRFREDTSVSVRDNYTIRMLHANPYRRNISLARIHNHKRIGDKFYAQAQLYPKPDIILTCMPTIDLTYQAVRYANEQGAISIVDIRDAWPDSFTEYFPDFLSPLVKFGIRGMDRKLCKALSCADAITSMADHGLEFGQKKAGRGRRASDRVFYLGYPDNSERADQGIGKWIEIGLSPESFIVVFFGTIANSSNLDHVIDAARLLHNEPVQFVLCGSGDTLKGLRQKAKDLNSVFIPGLVGASDIISLAGIAKAGLMPYKKRSVFSNGFPNKFAEFLCFGLPILTLTDGVARSFIEEHECGLPYDTAEELAMKIRLLKHDPQRQSEMSANSRRKYLEEFSAERVYGNMMKYLEEMAAGKVL